jgi:hypothetical protein
MDCKKKSIFNFFLACLSAIFVDVFEVNLKRLFEVELFVAQVAEARSSLGRFQFLSKLA